MDVVIDTNVFVSAFYSSNGTPSIILSLLYAKKIRLCFNEHLLAEYEDVLYREKFGFNKYDLDIFFNFIENNGKYVFAFPQDILFIDESDKKFYDVLRSDENISFLITGNKKHFPKENNIVSPSEFLEYLVI